MKVMANYRASYTTQEKQAFAATLRKLMLEKGLNGAELARRASAQLSKPMGRQSITNYLNGTTIPEEAALRALAKALGVAARDLLPRPHNLAPGELETAPATPNLDVRYTIQGGKMRLMLTAEVPAEIGWQIVNLLKESPPSSR
jgi:transcriptional regulator with XRE-family HTH domain